MSSLQAHAMGLTECDISYLGQRTTLCLRNTTGSIESTIDISEEILLDVEWAICVLP